MRKKNLVVAFFTDEKSHSMLGNWSVFLLFLYSVLFSLYINLTYVHNDKR